MAITAYTVDRHGNVSRVTVASDLVGAVLYHWYLDGAYLGMTTSPSRSVYVPAGEQARIEVLDTLDPAWDPIANAPAGYPARRTVWWVRAIDADAATYRIEQRITGQSWTAIAAVSHQPGAWTYRAATPRLEDLAYHQWQVVGLDALGNEIATPLGIARRIVRTPDAPAFGLSYDPGTQRITLSAA